MIYLPYSDDIRDSEEAGKYSWVYAKGFSAQVITDKIGGVLQIFPDMEDLAPRADEDQIKKASALIKRIDIKDFSVCQFANPGKLSCLFVYFNFIAWTFIGGVLLQLYEKKNIIKWHFVV